MRKQEDQDIKIKKNKILENKKSPKIYIEKFINSDSISATAGKFLLMTIALGGMVFVGALVPGILALTKESRKSHKYTKKQIQNAIYNLKKRKLIEIVKYDDDKVKVKLTNKGKERIKEFSLETLSIEKPKKWDGKWRILMFDIPTKPKIYNQAREALRSKIKELGFHQMQKSAWAYPYECEDEILFIAEIFNVQKHIEIITAEKLLHEEQIKRFFKML